MQISGDLRPFSKDDIDHAPEEAGVYALYRGDSLIYIGRAEGGLSMTTIRARLKNHQAGSFGPLTKAATHYRCEVRPDPVTRERELLREYEKLHGQLPRCNYASYLPRTGPRRTY